MNSYLGDENVLSGVHKFSPKMDNLFIGAFGISEFTSGCT